MIVSYFLGIQNCQKMNVIFSDLYLLQVIVGSFGMQGQKQFKLDHSDALGVPSFLLPPGSTAAKSPSSLGTVSESSGEPVSPHNQLAETSNISTPVVANNLPWR